MSELRQLRRQVLQLGGRLDGFDHALVGSSSKPSDPSDVRWDCLCGYAGSPETVKQHWEAHLAEVETDPVPLASALDIARAENAMMEALRGHDKAFDGEIHKCRHSVDLAARFIAALK